MKHYLPDEEAAAAQRRAEGRDGDHGPTGRAADLAGNRAGVSGKSVQRALKVLEADPEVFEAMLRGEYASIRKAVRAAKPPAAKESRSHSEPTPKPSGAAPADIDVVTAIDAILRFAEQGALRIPHSVCMNLRRARDEAAAQ